MISSWLGPFQLSTSSEAGAPHTDCMLFHIPCYLSPLASSSGTDIHDYCFPYRGPYHQSPTAEDDSEGATSTGTSNGALELAFAGE